MKKNTWAILAAAAALSVPLAACKDSKTLQENEQLKAQVLQLQKENGQAGNDLETMKADRDALAKENEKLKTEVKALQGKGGKKHSTHKRRRTRT